MPFFPGWLERHLLKIPYIYDLDDAFFLKYRTGRLRLFHSLLDTKTDRLMSAAVAVTAGNAHLAAYANRFNSSVALLPSVVDTDHYRPADACLLSISASPSPSVGLVASTAPYLQLLIEPCSSWPANAL